jgi:hypothetical protein
LRFIDNIFDLRGMNTSSPLRAAAPLNPVNPPLGLLAELSGCWTGSGFNLVAVPSRQGTDGFRLLLNATTEQITFTPIGAPVPNRGSAQDDIDIYGLTYLQRVNDAVTHEGLHIEPGIWLNVPATTNPPGPASIVRQSTIPHGDSVLAQGDGFVVPQPVFQPVSAMPFGPGLAGKSLGYVDPYMNSVLPPGMKQDYVTDMNLALADAIAGQTITNTVVLAVASLPVGGIVNIPFVTVNANATEMSAVFWIETVQRANGTSFLQLQYTQTVMLQFFDITWPHISVATLIKT